MLKYVALSAMMLAAPTFAEEEEQGRKCQMYAAPRTAEAFYFDIQEHDTCWIHAFGYYKGVVELGDEVWFFLPSGDASLNWQDGLALYRVWYITHLQHKDLPAYMAIISSLREHFPMPKKEEKDAEPK